ncbi:Rieske 2Fe-2S domain-containing protein [Parvularcula sp. IMCC14364]|uniref:Rieske 2Fe-2S domain-containing protein n=1 Tax=Parvularcula sp. IMCC14364 TaxID=3067902 RepID=UPI0027426406|nr:Rieske 2Fe-2S domain-containing protein [Parvularcula sp. IMCC14364]
MGHQYQAVQWNSNKLQYDLAIAVFAFLYISVFVLTGLQPTETGHTPDPVVLLIRAFGTCAFLLLSFILMIGPLARLSDRFKPMLYNRRHFGVFTFLIAAVHFLLALVWYHGFGPINPLLSLFVSNQPGGTFPGFPFEVFGLVAFVIMLLMAVTSHDFWLNNLSAPVWKALHMLVYVAYGLLIIHIAAGALLTEKSLLYPALVLVSFITVAGLHILTGLRESGNDRLRSKFENEGWIAVAAPQDIPDKRAVIVPVASGERVAVFRDHDKLSAVTNVCRHQNGPLGEGRIVDGCVTCPWHGWQYRMEDGISPPPFTEKIATYNLKLMNGMVFLNPEANAPGTYVEPVRFDLAADQVANTNEVPA